MRPDLAIVGGGVIGLCAAWEARRTGRSVVVLERHDVGAGSSGAAAGMLLPEVEGEHDAEEREFGLQSYALYPDFAREIEEVSALPTGYRRSDCYLVAQSRERADVLRRMGYGEWLDPGDLKRVLAYVGTTFGARRGPAAQVEPRLLVRALATALERRGVEIRRSAEVMSVEEGEGKVLGLRLGDGGRVEAGSYLFASGAWASGLSFLRRRGVEVAPVKGQIVELAAHEGTSPADIIFGEGIYFAPKEGERIFLGATEEHAGFDARPTADGALRLLEGMRRLMPAGMAWSVRGTWAGLRPWREGGPLISRLEENAAVAAGHYRNGVLLAPATAQRAVGLLP